MLLYPPGDGRYSSFCYIWGREGQNKGQYQRRGKTGRCGRGNRFPGLKWNRLRFAGTMPWEGAWRRKSTRHFPPSDGDDSGRKVHIRGPLVYRYSGRFDTFRCAAYAVQLPSTQNDLPSLLGAMAKITIKKDVKTGAIQIPEHEFIPLLMHYNHDSRTYGIYKLDDYTQELADQHTANERNPGEFSISYYKDLFAQIKAKGNADGI